ncbi:MAG: hypothetical protein RR998_03285 [Oscillospiraceae bacterium]
MTVLSDLLIEDIYDVQKLESDKQGRRWALVCGGFWVCVDTEAAALMRPEPTLYLFKAVASARDCTLLTAKAKSLGLVAEIAPYGKE